MNHNVTPDSYKESEAYRKYQEERAERAHKADELQKAARQTVPNVFKAAIQFMNLMK